MIWLLPVLGHQLFFVSIMPLNHLLPVQMPLLAVLQLMILIAPHFEMLVGSLVDMCPVPD